MLALAVPPDEMTSDDDYSKVNITPPDDAKPLPEDAAAQTIHVKLVHPNPFNPMHLEIHESVPCDAC